ncbi:neuropeptide Y receptor type 2-like [Uranotaenia lowii]|uniref:neuropeptide Y receptor type 2-like n=1 Tax=Uranotaenia lowii TaxID=190385 RepID=UPI0024784575|nr:neuropeptide Y receptor type 2-like [Uranotaenia lowii]
MRTGFNLQPEDAVMQRIPAPRFLFAEAVRINTSYYHYPAEIWDQIPDKDIIIKLTIMIPIVLFGILGNTALLEIILSNRALRTPTHLLIANLALIDLVNLVFCPPIFLLHDVHQSYVLGPIGCKLEGFIEGGLLITSIFALCIVSYDRLAAIVLPSSARFTKKYAIIASIVSWTMGFTAALPLALFRNYRERNWQNFQETFCAEDREFMPHYWDYIVVLLVWFPLGMMVVTYSAILCKLDHYERKAMNREHPMVVRYKSRVAKTLFFVLMTFVVVRIPFTVMIMLYYNHVDDANRFEVSEGFVLIWWIAKVAFMFLYSTLNPVTYGLTNRTFRKAFKTSRVLGFIWRCSKVPEESDKMQYNGTFKTWKFLFPRDPCGNDKLNNQLFTERPLNNRNRYFPSWLNPTIRLPGKRLETGNKEDNFPNTNNGTKSSGAGNTK